MVTIDSDMLVATEHSRGRKVLTAVYKNNGAVYEYGNERVPVSRYKADKIRYGAVNGSVGQTMWAEVLGNIPYRRVR